MNEETSFTECEALSVFWNGCGLGIWNPPTWNLLTWNAQTGTWINGLKLCVELYKIVYKIRLKTQKTEILRIFFFH